jgi:hypothetical protein
MARFKKAPIVMEHRHACGRAGQKPRSIGGGAGSGAAGEEAVAKLSSNDCPAARLPAVSHSPSLGALTLGLILLPSMGIVVPLAGHAQEFAPGCNADLAAVDASFGETLDRLDGVANGSDAEKCAAYRHHVDVMLKGREVFLRCIPEGRDQTENVVQLEVSIADFETIIANKQCAP